AAGGPARAVPAAHPAWLGTGIAVPIEPGSRPAKQVSPDEGSAAGYRSNSWRQRTDVQRGLSFSSARLAPAFGLDPALEAHADDLRAQGGGGVDRFLPLRVPAHKAGGGKVRSADVALLGPPRRP